MLKVRHPYFLHFFPALTSSIQLAAPFRMAFFFFLTAYTYVLRPGRGNTDISNNPLKNSLVFTWAFVEVIMWFWVRLATRPGYRSGELISVS